MNGNCKFKNTNLSLCVSLTWQISNRTLSPTLGGFSQSFRKYIIVFLVLACVYVITPPSIRSWDFTGLLGASRVTIPVNKFAHFNMNIFGAVLSFEFYELIIMCGTRTFNTFFHQCLKLNISRRQVFYSNGT